MLRRWDIDRLEAAYSAVCLLMIAFLVFLGAASDTNFWL